MRISIHAPAKGATLLRSWRSMAGTYFNPRSREGSDRYDRRYDHLYPHFNPRSREGSDPMLHPTDICKEHISIHAPAKGATAIPSSFYDPVGISIHAPAKGATVYPSPFFHRDIHFNPRSREGSDRLSRVLRIGVSDFNPRSREGSDHYRRPYGIELQLISIHAPAKGATNRFSSTRS